MANNTDPARPSDNADSTRERIDRQRSREPGTRKAGRELLDPLPEGETEIPELETQLDPLELDDATNRQAMDQTLASPDEISTAHVVALVAEWANADEAEVIVDSKDAIYDGRAWLDDQERAEFYQWANDTYGVQAENASEEGPL